MQIANLMEILPQNFSVVDREMVMRAYNFADEMHTGQRRVSGEPYVSHCVAVAGILAEMQVTPTIVIAALLHDTVEDTRATPADIQKEFGDEVAKLVEGVTKLTNLPPVSRGD